MVPALEHFCYLLKRYRTWCLRCTSHSCPGQPLLCFCRFFFFLHILYKWSYTKTKQIVIHYVVVCAWFLLESILFYFIFWGSLLRGSMCRFLVLCPRSPASVCRWHCSQGGSSHRDQVSFQSKCRSRPLAGRQHTLTAVELWGDGPTASLLSSQELEREINLPDRLRMSTLPPPFFFFN